MEKGTIIDYIDKQKMVCAVVIDSIIAGSHQVRLLTENDRDVRLPVHRISYAGGRLDPAVGRSALVEMLRATALKREDIAKRISIESLWELVRDENQWIDLKTMTEMCFSEPVTPDHEAALVRAIFADRLYFKFNHNRFLPHSEEQIKAILARREKEERHRRLINEGSEWLKTVCKGPVAEPDENVREVVEILVDYYLFGKDAGEYAIAKEIITMAGGISPDTLFSLLVRLGVWDPHENTDLLKHGVPVSWPDKVLDEARSLSGLPGVSVSAHQREDLTGLYVITIDGADTLDFDDALSIEQLEDGSSRIGIHISDVAERIKRGGALDTEALRRGSSIYTADLRIPMFPPVLSEGVCSLKAGENRPAISVIAEFSPQAELVDFRVTASIINVDKHLTYADANAMIGSDNRIASLYRVASSLRERRLKDGALIIDLPEIMVGLDKKRHVNLRRIEQRSPARVLVEEMMIVANWILARFLRDRNIPAVFRSQPEPRQRLFKKGETNNDLFLNWVQRKLVSHASLGCKPGRHCGLGLDLYTTATSPIRKYIDLITQRQVRAGLDLGTPYTKNEIDHLLHELEKPLGYVGKIQQARHRYWVLKYLETMVGTSMDAIVLDRFKNEYSILLPDYLVECRLPAPRAANLNPKDIVRVKVQHVNARQNIISVFFS